MKVTFIQPPVEDFYYTPIRRQPLGLLYLASVAKKNKWDVSLINAHSNKKHVINLPEDFFYLTEFINSKNSEYQFPFKHYYHFGLSYQEIRRQIKDETTDLFAISSLFTPYYQEVDKIIKIIKEEKPAIPIVIGGSHATLNPEYYINNNVQYVITGEGEIPFEKLLTNINSSPEKLNQIDGLKTQKNLNKKHQIQPVKELDSLTFPARNLLKKRDFKIYKKNGISMITSRGCPNKCNFCTSKKIFGTNYRTRSINNILNEIEYCIKNFNTTLINFEDDNIFYNQDKTEQFLKELIKYQQTNSIKLDLTAMNGISIENLSTEHLILMKKAGFKELNLSLVTSGITLQNFLKRPFDTQHFEKIVQEALKLNFNTRAYFILGLPEQTKKEIIQTIKYLKNLKIKTFPSVYYNIYEKNISNWKIQRSSAFANESRNLSRYDLIKYFKQIINS